MTRSEYERLLVVAAQRIHESSCYAPAGGCQYEAGLSSMECLDADAAFGVLFEHWGVTVPVEQLLGDALW